MARKRWRARILRSFEYVLYWLAIVLVIVGGVAAWIAPRLDPALPLVALMRTPATAIVHDPSAYFGAELTTLGVIIAILIGYNVAAFQVVAQRLALGLVRAILFTLVPLLMVWLIASSVVLVYLLAPPPFIGNLWQAGCWFVATALLLISYLASLPNKLSGAYATRWALNDLRDVPVDEWESTDGFTVLQEGLGVSVGSADVGTLRQIALPLGRFLSGQVDADAEGSPGYVRARTYALRNLFAGCAPYRSSMPGAVAYNLAFAAAGTLLQGAATGQTFLYTNGGLLDVVLPTGPNVAERMVAFWAGLRHALCRRGPQGEPYLRRYWLQHARLPEGDERRVQVIADSIVQLYVSSWRELNALDMHAANDVNANDVNLSVHAVELLIEFYRYLQQYLAVDASHERNTARKQQVVTLTIELLDAVQEKASLVRPLPTADAFERLNHAYRKYRDALQQMSLPD